MAPNKANQRKFAIAAGFIPQLGVSGERRNWRQSPKSFKKGDFREKQQARRFQEIEGVNVRGTGGSLGVNAEKLQVPGSVAWYQHSGSKAGVKKYEENLKKSDGWMPNRIKSAMGMVQDPMMAAMWAASKIVRHPGVLGKKGDVERNFLGDTFKHIKKVEKRYTQQVLSEMNDQLGSHLASAQGQEIKGVSKSAMAVPEQVGVLEAETEGQKEKLEAQLKQDKIGATQGIDVIYKVGNTFFRMEETESLATKAGHHGLNTAAIDDATMEKLLKEEKGWDVSIAEKYKESINKEIKSNWNPAIRDIKKIAKDTYKTDKPSAEQMRKPSGIGTKDPKDAEKRLESDSARDMKKLLTEATTKGSKIASMTTLKHINHYIGTFNEHLGKGVHHGMTVSHEPQHISVSAELKQYGAAAAKAYEFRAVQQAETHRGYMSLSIMKNHQSDVVFNSEDVANKMKAGHLGIRMGINAKGIMMGAIAGSTALQGANPQVGFSYIIPEGDGAAIEDWANKLLEHMGEHLGGETGRQTRAVARKHAGNFQRSMDRLRTKAERNGLPKTLPYRFWASPFYSASSQN